MDTALNTGGDFKTDDEGIPYLISGSEEIWQKIYILLSSREGEFIYDRNLGSRIHDIDRNSDGYLEKVTAEVRRALKEFPEAEVLDVTLMNGSPYIRVDVNGEKNWIFLRG